MAMAMATANVSSRQQTMKEVEGSMLDGWQGFGVVRRAVSTCSWCRYPRYYTYSPFPNPVVDLVREGLSLPIACRYLGKEVPSGTLEAWVFCPSWVSNDVWRVSDGPILSGVV